MSMENLSNSRKNNKSRKEELITAADHKQSEADPPTHSTVDIPSDSEITTIQRPGTLPQLRANKEHIYAPVVFPPGPYYHGGHQFDQAEQLKNKVLNIKLDENGKGLARSEFLKRAQEIRNCYGGVSEREYDDKTLAEMMLRDACFVVYYMDASTGNRENERHIFRHLGQSGSLFMYRDFYMLENQVPSWAIKLLISLTLFNHDDDNVDAYIWKYASVVSCDDEEFSDAIFMGGVPWGEGKEREPLHLIAVIYRATLFKPPKIVLRLLRDQEMGFVEKFSRF